jgi:hypothetical protein
MLPYAFLVGIGGGNSPQLWSKKGPPLREERNYLLNAPKPIQHSLIRAKLRKGRDRI